MTRRRIVGLAVFAAFVLGGIVWLLALGGSLDEPRYRRPAECETQKRVADLNGDAFKALLAQQIDWRRTQIDSPPDFSFKRLTQGQADQLRNGQPTGPPMIGANLGHADLSHLDLHDIDFSDADLSCADFSNAHLRNASIPLDLCQLAAGALWPFSRSG
jgi:hypothetical protein